MKVTKNEVVNFTSHNITESASAWVLENLYNYEDEVLFEDYVYKYSGENGTNSSTVPALADTWTKIRPNNIIAMLDNKPSTYTQMQDKIEVTFISKGFDKLALFNVVAKSVTVEITSILNPTTTKAYTKTLLNKAAITNLRDFATAELEFETSLELDISIIHNAAVKVTIENQGSIARCGHLVSGKSYYIGVTSWDIGMGLSSFSKKETNELGEINFIKRGITDLDDFSVTIDSNRARLIKQKFKDYDALLLLFTIVENYKVGVISNFGYWEDFYILLSGPVKSEANITIQGVL